MKQQIILYAADSKEEKMFTLLFENFGLNSRVATKESKLYVFFEDKTPSLLFMDVFGGGMQICYELKNSIQYAHIPIILYRGWRHPLFIDNIDYANLQQVTKANYVFTSRKIDIGILKEIIHTYLPTRQDL